MMSDRRTTTIQRSIGFRDENNDICAIEQHVNTSSREHSTIFLHSSGDLTRSHVKHLGPLVRF